MNSEYPKTENLYARSDETHKLIPGVFKRADFAQVDRWLVTEKVDGTNIRIIYNRILGTVEARGRSDAAPLPGKEGRFMEQAFPDGLDLEAYENALVAIDPTDKAGLMVIYGEGYGAGIQKGGGDYRDSMGFVAFDVRTYKATDMYADADRLSPPPREECYRYHDPLWRTWADVETVCTLANLETVPVLATDVTTAKAVYYAREPGPWEISHLAHRNGKEPKVPEGIVARTDPYLFDFRGERVMFKLKPADFAADAE